MKIRVLSANVFKHYEDCSNGGITSRHGEILIPHSKGWQEVDTENLPENFCRLESLEFGGKPHLRFIPAIVKDSGKWCMFGGCFAYSSDSRFRDISEYPIPIHDRVEA